MRQFHIDTLTLAIVAGGYVFFFPRVVAHGPHGSRKRALTTLSSGILPNEP